MHTSWSIARIIISAHILKFPRNLEAFYSGQLSILFLIQMQNAIFFSHGLLERGRTKLSPYLLTQSTSFGGVASFNNDLFTSHNLPRHLAGFCFLVLGVFFFFSFLRKGFPPLRKLLLFIPFPTRNFLFSLWERGPCRVQSMASEARLLSSGSCLCCSSAMWASWHSLSLSFL